MLALSEFFVGTIADAPAGSLLLPHSKYGVSGIVASHKDAPFFVILAEEHRFQGFPAGGNTSHKGVIVPGVGIEVDETSVGEFDAWETPRGSVVCAEGIIGIRTGMGERGAGSSVVATLAPVPTSSIGATFSRWQITLGNGAQKRVLMTVDASRGRS